MFSEAVKAIGSMGGWNHQPSIEYSAYTQDVSAAYSGDVSVALATAVYWTSSAISGLFYVGLDLESYANSDKLSIFSKWNSNTDDIYFIPTYAAQGANNSFNTRFDAFAHFNTVNVFENGTAYEKV